MIAKIVRITPDGAAFTTTNGTFFPFSVGLDTGHSGQANSKSNPPPWRVGEIIGYAITGQTPRGADKLKITRNPDQSFGNYVPPVEGEHLAGDPLPMARTANPAPATATLRPISTQPPSYSPPARKEEHLPINLPHPACVGACVNKAVEVWIATLGKDQPWGEESGFTVERIASELIAIHQRLEKGQHPTDASCPF